MSASLVRLINTLPVPIFGSTRTAAMFVTAKAKALPRMVGWAAPLGAGALWFIWPAVDDEWKIEMGIKADPQAAAKAAEEAAAAAPTIVELSAEAEAKVEDAYKAHEHVETETEDDNYLAKAAVSGDYAELEEKWDAFVVKVTQPGEDDDDEDEDDDDDDEEEEEEEDDEE
jgi:hypothetical protein